MEHRLLQTLNARGSPAICARVIATIPHRACQIGACAERVPTALSRQGVCVGHYLDQAFTRVAMAMESCRRGQPLEPPMAEWLMAQGDLAVQLLSRDGGQPAEDRSRILDLLVCLANIQEYARQ